MEGNSYLTEGILEPCSEKLTQSGAVVARALVNLTDGFVSMQIGKFTNETITVFKDTVAAVCDEASQIETDNPIELQKVYQINQVESQAIPEHLAIL